MTEIAKAFYLNLKLIINNLTTTEPYKSSRPKNLKFLQDDLTFQEVLIWNIFILNRIDKLFKNSIELLRIQIYETNNYKQKLRLKLDVLGKYYIS